MFISRIAHVALGVADVEQAIAFYGDLLGLDVLWRGDDHVYLATGTSTSFELELGPYETGLDHFAFYVRSPEALDEASQRLKDAGIAVGEAAVDEPGLGAGIAFVLPSGFAMELVTETEPHGFENSAAIAPAHYAATGPLPLRHVTLLSPDIRADATFLIEQLGFRITDSWRPSEDQQWMSTFARVGDDHHDLALLPPNRPEPQLHHFAFAVPSVADMVRVSDALAARGMAVDSSIGRHVAGNNIFVYFKDPFGNRVELYTELAKINPAAPPRIHREPMPYDAWREGRPPAMTAGSPCRDAREVAGP